MFRVRPTLSSLLGGAGRLLLAGLLFGSLAAFAPAAAQAADDAPGAVYVMSNAVSGNAVLAFERGENGALTPAGTFATGGAGTAASLGSQGALVLSADGRWLFAVNAGSSSISVFAVRPHGLQLESTVPSGGPDPISLTAHDDRLYVLNAGDPGEITGFRLGHDGRLSALSNSTRFLSNAGVGAAPGPAEVAFNPDGRVLVVTEKNTNLIDTFTLDDDGRPSNAVTHASAGLTPYGFAFGRHNTFVVSDAANPAASSYRVAGNNVQVITGVALTNGQAAPCWVAVTGDGRYAYTANAGSNSVTGFTVAPDGSLSLLTASGQTGLTGAGSHPTDMAMSQNSRYLYVSAGGTHQVVIFRVQADGSLTALGSANLPTGTAGLAAW